MSDHVDLPRNRTRGSKACTACRQVKLRCDVKSNFPGPCTRCKSTGRLCRVDPSFKRISTRHQLEQVTSQLTDLRQRFEIPSLASGPSSRFTNDVVPPENFAQTHDHSSPPENSTDALLHASGSTNATDATDDMFGLRRIKFGDLSPAHLDTTDVTPEQIYDLFSFFAEYQFDYLPVVDTRASISTIQNSHPLLFWTIIVTAGKYHRTHHHLASSLKKAYPDLLAQSLIRAPITLPLIQAIVLLCYWPFPCLKQIFDPSWNLYGIALNAARFLGLDQSADKLSFKISHEDYRVRARGWLSCFHVGTILALHWGVPLPISSTSDLRQVKHFIATITVPHVFVTQLRAHHEISQYRASLPSDKTLGSIISMTRLFEANIDRMINSSVSELDEASQICQLRTKISLYANILMVARSESRRLQMADNDFSASIILTTISGLHAASRLLHAFSVLCERAARNTGYTFETDVRDSDSAPLLCVPKQYLMAASIATMFLVAFCIFNDQISPEDKTLAENMVKLSYQLYDRLSKRSSDEVARAAAVVKVICKAGSWEMVVTDRECASIWFDACHRAADLRGKSSSEKFLGGLTSANRAEADTGNPTTSSPVVDAPSIQSYDDLDAWLSLPEFSGMDWSLADDDVFGSAILS